MRNLLAFLAALGLTFGVVGWYLDWYKIQSAPNPEGHRNVNIDVNTKKIGEDLKKGEDKLLDKASEKARDGLGKAPLDEAGKRVESLPQDTARQVPQQ